MFQFEKLYFKAFVVVVYLTGMVFIYFVGEVSTPVVAISVAIPVVVMVIVIVLLGKRFFHQNIKNNLNIVFYSNLFNLM